MLHRVKFKLGHGIYYSESFDDYADVRQMICNMTYPVVQGVRPLAVETSDDGTEWEVADNHVDGVPQNWLSPREWDELIENMSGKG